MRLPFNHQVSSGMGCPKEQIHISLAAVFQYVFCTSNSITRQVNHLIFSHRSYDSIGNDVFSSAADSRR